MEIAYACASRTRPNMVITRDRKPMVVIVCQLDRYSVELH